jgi:hypothetical protein
VDAWLRYSEDQRIADSWYLVTRRDEDGNERWIVGNPSTGDELQYQDAATAGAGFVSRVLGTPYVLPDDQ